MQDVIDSVLVDDSVIRVMENPNSNFYNKQNAILEKHAFDHPIWTSVDTPWEMGFFGNKISYQNKNDMDLDSDIAMHFIVDEVSRLMEERDVRSKHMEVLQYLSTIVDFEYEENFATMGANALKGIEHVALKDLME